MDSIYMSLANNGWSIASSPHLRRTGSPAPPAWSARCSCLLVIIQSHSLIVLGGLQRGHKQVPSEPDVQAKWLVVAVDKSQGCPEVALVLAWCCRWFLMMLQEFMPFNIAGELPTLIIKKRPAAPRYPAK
ncbi:unnamed protein product [Zymoseptoria tritici ST99CH_1A5]|uniref:Uncharacterized protein n=1 Tax=Zymoseptoria tritici ST99CH_1A5 TaxID=1276529 RepID=A0A1Y6LUB6_ZYMTR|nr:unnamed protein product [Zymoseptoria tritici ST99CH_1A5]